MKCMDCGQEEEFSEIVSGTFSGTRDLETDEIEFDKVNVNEGFYQCDKCYSSNIEGGNEY